MSQDSTRKTFFRQSGWMVFCTVLSGIACYGVHFFNRAIPESEYGVFQALLAALNCMGIPALGLQMVFAHQTAMSITREQGKELAATARGVALGTFVLWMGAAVFIVWNFKWILAQYGISNPITLWLMLAVSLASVWGPIFGGLLQGKQNFLWAGWSAILNSAGRLAAIAIFVLVFHGYAAGMAGGLLIGVLLSLAVCVVFTRDLWLERGTQVDWGTWLRRMVPLTLGLGAFQFMFSADPLFVQRWFDKDQTAFYGAAGTMGRALCAFTGPVVGVMFPKLVRSVALSEKSNVLTLTLIVTAVMVTIGAVALPFVGPLVLGFMYKSSYQASAPLLSWFAIAMAPLALANVLLNNLLARSQFAVVPWVVLVAIGYAVALTQNHGTFIAVIQTLCVSNIIFLAVVSFFAWRESRAQCAPPVSNSHFDALNG